MKKQKEFVDKVYKLTRDAAPLSFMLPTRNTKRFPLLYFDEDAGFNRALRYAKNQKSPFEDEQDGNAVLEPVIFENGFLRVPKNNPVLQEFLYYHPLNGKKFVEINNEQDAQKELDLISIEADALVQAKSLSIDQMEVLCRGLFGKDPMSMTTAELKRDVLVFAKRNPQEFLNAVSSPELKLYAKVQMFLDEKLIAFRNKKKDVHFNLADNKKRMLSIPYGKDPVEVIAGFFQSDEGLDVLEMLDAYANF
jgi:hypothetical protein